jgi:hypothetical protein
VRRRMKAPMAALEELGLPYREAEWEHGLRCADCPHTFREGERFTTRLYAFSDDVPMALVVCLDCATGEPTRGNEPERQARPA